ncbi:MAG: hypothetical protein JXR44_05565 [Thiotrichales bacterium]|nr:hypothetical protein [Thiotrichales bacterium]
MLTINSLFNDINLSANPQLPNESTHFSALNNLNGLLEQLIQAVQSASGQMPVVNDLVTQLQSQVSQVQNQLPLLSRFTDTETLVTDVIAQVEMPLAGLPIELPVTGLLGGHSALPSLENLGVDAIGLKGSLVNTDLLKTDLLKTNIISGLTDLSMLNNLETLITTLLNTVTRLVDDLLGNLEGLTGQLPILSDLDLNADTLPLIGELLPTAENLIGNEAINGLSSNLPLVGDLLPSLLPAIGLTNAISTDTDTGTNTVISLGIEQESGLNLNELLSVGELGELDSLLPVGDLGALVESILAPVTLLVSGSEGVASGLLSLESLVAPVSQLTSFDLV